MNYHKKIHELGHLLVIKLPIIMEVKSVVDFLQIDFECSRNDVLTDYNPQVKIYKNPCFVFDFTSLEFLTVFSTVIWTGS